MIGLPPDTQAGKAHRGFKADATVTLLKHVLGISGQVPQSIRYATALSIQRANDQALQHDLMGSRWPKSSISMHTQPNNKRSIGMTNSSNQMKYRTSIPAKSCLQNQMGLDEKRTLFPFDK